MCSRMAEGRTLVGPSCPCGSQIGSTRCGVRSPGPRLGIRLYCDPLYRFQGHHQMDGAGRARAWPGICHTSQEEHRSADGVPSGYSTEIRRRPAHKGIAGDEKPDAWAGLAPEEPGADGVQWLRCEDRFGGRLMPPPPQVASPSQARDSGAKVGRNTSVCRGPSQGEEVPAAEPAGFGW